MNQGLLFPELEDQTEIEDFFRELEMWPTNHVFDKLSDDIKQYFNHTWDRKKNLIDGDYIYEYYLKKEGRRRGKGRIQFKKEYAYLGENKNCDYFNLPRKSIVYIPLRKGFIRKTGETDQIGRRKKDPEYKHDEFYKMCFLDEWVGKEICGIEITDTSRDIRLAVEKLMQGLIAHHFKSFNPNDNYG
jgi:hypothetical protein